MNKLLIIFTLFIGLSSALRVCDKTLIISDDKSAGHKISEIVAGNSKIIAPKDFIANTLIDSYGKPKYCNVIAYLPSSGIEAASVREIVAAVTETPQHAHLERYRHINEASGVNLFLITSHRVDGSVRSIANPFGLKFENYDTKDVNTIVSDIPEIASGSVVIKNPLNVFLSENFEGHRFPLFTAENLQAGVAMQSTVTNTRVTVVTFDIIDEPFFKDLVDWTLQKKHCYRISELKYTPTNRTIGQFSSLDKVKFSVFVEKYDAINNEWTPADISSYHPQLYLTIANDNPSSVYNFNYDGDGLYSATATLFGRANVKAVVDFHRRGLSHLDMQEAFLTTAVTPHDMPKAHRYGLPAYATAFSILAMFIFLPFLHKLGAKSE